MRNLIRQEKVEIPPALSGNKEGERQKIADDVTKFLSSGGTIKTSEDVKSMEQQIAEVNAMKSITRNNKVIKIKKIQRAHMNLR